MQNAQPTPEARADLEWQIRPAAGRTNEPIKEHDPGYQGMGQRGDILAVQNGGDFRRLNSPADFSANIEQEILHLEAAGALHPWFYPPTHVGKDDEKTRR